MTVRSFIKYRDVFSVLFRLDINKNIVCKEYILYVQKILIVGESTFSNIDE